MYPLIMAPFSNYEVKYDKDYFCVQSFTLINCAPKTTVAFFLNSYDFPRFCNFQDTGAFFMFMEITHDINKTMMT